MRKVEGRGHSILLNDLSGLQHDVSAFSRCAGCIRGLRQARPTMDKCPSNGGERQEITRICKKIDPDSPKTMNHANSANNNWASRRSGVSKPSVNQP